MLTSEHYVIRLIVTVAFLRRVLTYLHTRVVVCLFVVDMDNMYNCSCERALLNDSKSLRRQCNDRGTTHFYHLLPASGTHAE